MLTLILASLIGAQGTAPVADKAAEQDKLICKSKPLVGSRLKKVKTCMTSAEWAAFRLDRDQGRRDQVSGFAKANTE